MVSLSLTTDDLALRRASTRFPESRALVAKSLDANVAQWLRRGSILNVNLWLRKRILLRRENTTDGQSLSLCLREAMSTSGAVDDNGITITYLAYLHARGEVIPRLECWRDGTSI